MHTGTGRKEDGWRVVSDVFEPVTPVAATGIVFDRSAGRVVRNPVGYIERALLHGTFEVVRRVLVSSDHLISCRRVFM